MAAGVAIPLVLFTENEKMMMRETRIGLILPVGRLWVMSMPFRLAAKAPGFGFAPGLRNLLRYEARRVWHWLYERERMVLVGLRLGARLRKR